LELILFRHGIAEDREDFEKKNLDDHLRPLTLKGRKRVQKVGIKLRDWVSEVDVIVSSPYTRARQTAEILSQIYFETPVLEAPELVPQSPAPAFVKWLKAHAREYSRVIMVGHEPQMTSFASYLLAGKQESFLSLRKGGVMCMELESFNHAETGSAELLWLIPPRMIID
jgi:phosphohistidine phosphatase